MEEITRYKYYFFIFFCQILVENYENKFERKLYF